MFRAREKVSAGDTGRAGAGNGSAADKQVIMRMKRYTSNLAAKRPLVFF